jgi:D-amino peptidase
VRVYMSVDLEGITGVVGSYQVLQDPGALPEVRELLLGDVNAAIAGAKEGGATAIVVNENHSGRDLLLERLDPMADVLVGKPKPLQTLDRLDSSFDCVFLVGIHAQAGTDGAVLDHTWGVKCVQALRVSGITIGEIGLNALLAGHYGVPVALVTGDVQTVREAESLLGNVVGVAVKEGVSRYAAYCPHPSKAREAIRQGAARAVREAKHIKPFTLPAPMKIEIDYANSAFAEAASWIPTAVREGPRTVSFTVADFLSGMRAFVVAATLPYHLDDPVY